MDPNQTLQELMDTAERVIHHYDEEVEIDEEDSHTLAYGIMALNEWFTKGGFLPDEWFKARARFDKA